MFCKLPFHSMFLQGGWASCCCPIWDNSFDNRPDYEQTPQELWRNCVNEELRRRVMEHDYSMCGRCPHITDNVGGSHENWEAGPKRLYVGDSFVCNLYCWSCRGGRCTGESDEALKDKFLRDLIEAYRPNLEMVHMLQTGEVFASKRHVDLLSNFDWGNIKIGIISNGTLVQRHWQRIKNIHDRICETIVSLDAATKETYQTVRLGGHWEAAIAGAEILAEHSPCQRFHFCVSDRNVHEMQRFADFIVSKFDPETIEFVRVARTYKRDDWDQRDPWLLDHPLRKLAEQQVEAVKQYPCTVLKGFER